ncbi:hypothetical protein I546_0649 [Mycobacterium kansasii 732]|nr:hypothetical protein I546_0649 [Mycobacterium kansasii 732]
MNPGSQPGIDRDALPRDHRHQLTTTSGPTRPARRTVIWARKDFTFSARIAGSPLS